MKDIKVVDSVEKLEDAIVRVRAAQKSLLHTHRSRLIQFSVRRHLLQTAREYRLQSLR